MLFGPGYSDLDQLSLVDLNTKKTRILHAFDASGPKITRFRATGRGSTLWLWELEQTRLLRIDLADLD